MAASVRWRCWGVDQPDSGFRLTTLHCSGARTHRPQSGAIDIDRADELFDWLKGRAIDVVDQPHTFSAESDDAGVLEGSKVIRQRRLGREVVGEDLSGRRIAAPQRQNDVPPRGVGQRPKNTLAA